MHDGVANVLTALGHFVQTPGGHMVKVEPDMEYDDSVIYRYVENDRKYSWQLNFNLWLFCLNIIYLFCSC